MIPKFNENGYLPPGIWDATIAEVQQRFAQTPHRSRLFQAFQAVVEILRAANCPELHLNGSYVTSSEVPGDYDMCYEPTGMAPTAAFRTFLTLTAEQRKAHYLGDIFIRLPQPPYFFDFVENWQTDREAIPKGIIRIQLGLDAND